MSFISKIIPFIVWIPTIFFVLIVLRHTLSGIRRGRSKSIKLLITAILAIIVAFIVYVILQKRFDTLSVDVCNIFKIDLKTKLGTTSNYDTLTEYFEEMLSNNEDVLSAIEQCNLSVIEAAKLIYSLALVGVNLILFVVCIVVYLIADFIFYLLYLVFASKDKRKKKNRDGEDAAPYKKHRLTGGLIGLVRGIVASIFVLAPIGIISFLITDGEVYDVNTDEIEDNKTKNIAEITRVVTQYDSVGIGKVLSAVKNKEGLPIYLIVADKITTAKYTYTDENGETKELELSLSKDIGSLTRPICKTGYLFLKYGYDISKNGDSQYLAEFLSSDKTIDGKTLEEAISETLADLTVDESSMLGYTCNLLAISLAQKSVGSDVDESNLDSQELSKKILYHVFIGKNSIKCTDVISENTGTVFSILFDVIKNKDVLNSLGKAFNSESGESSLVYGISKTASSKDTTRGAEFVNELYEDLKGLSFFETPRFNNLLTDCLKDILGSYLPKFDFTSVTNQNMYDINWSNSISTIFTSFGALIDNVVNNNIESSEDLMHFYLNQLSNSESDVYKRINDIVDTSAIAIILNTNGFNDFITDTLNKSLTSITSEEVSLPKTCWGSYTNSDGLLVSGELKKFINNAIPTFAKIYNVTYKSDELTDEQIAKVIQIICDPKGDIACLVDTTNENHSILVHAMISNIMTNLSIDSEESSVKICYETSVMTTLDSNGEKVSVISTENLKELMNFLYDNSTNVPAIQDGSVDLIEFVRQNSNTIKNSTILLDLVSQLFYSYSGETLEIPERFALNSENVENNLTLWTDKENGEMVKLLNIIDDEFDLIKSATSDSSFDINLIFEAKDSMDKLLTSDIIWYTMSSALFDVDDLIITENDALTDDYNETYIKKDEFVALINVLDVLTSVDSEGNRDISNIDMDLDTIYNNRELIKQSSIIRTKVTEEISKENVLIISRYSTISQATDYYVDTFRTYQNKTLTKTTIRQLKSSEIEYFLVGVKTILGSNSSYNIDYNSINIRNIDESCLNSSVILNGLQDLLKEIYAEADKSYVYYLSNDQTNNEFITKEKAIKQINSLR